MSAPRGSKFFAKPGSWVFSICVAKVISVSGRVLRGVSAATLVEALRAELSCNS